MIFFPFIMLLPVVVKYILNFPYEGKQRYFVHANKLEWTTLRFTIIHISC